MAPLESARPALGDEQALLEDLARRVARLLRPNRGVCYTVNLADYDQVRRPLAPSGFDFICFSSGKRAPRPWKTVPVTVPEALGPTRFNRLLKLFPHLLFPTKEHSVYMDANLQPLRPLGTLVDRLGGSDMVVSAHRLRSCTYGEAQECVARNKDASEVIEAQMARYRAEGFPMEWGLGENGVIVRRHGAATGSLMAAWWSEISRGSRRDQLSLMYCSWRWKIPVTLSPVGTLFRRTRENAEPGSAEPYFGLHGHGLRRRGLNLLFWRLNRMLTTRSAPTQLSKENTQP